MGGYRPQRIADEIQKIVSSILISGELRDPVPGIISITEVRMTRDLQQARLFVSTLGDREEKEQALRFLKHHNREIRTLLAGKMRLRAVPVLLFHLDDSLEHSQRIDELLDKIREERPQQPEDSAEYDDS